MKNKKPPFEITEKIMNYVIEIALLTLMRQENVPTNLKNASKTL